MGWRAEGFEGFGNWEAGKVIIRLIRLIYLYAFSLPTFIHSLFSLRHYFRHQTPERRFAWPQRRGFLGVFLVNRVSRGMVA